MGTFRLLLALSVLLSHLTVGGPQLVGGAAAVEVFFVISGFYMAMILTEKYVGPGSYRLFLGNRFLRLYPAYWTVVACAAAFWLAAGAVRGHRGPLDRYGPATPWPTQLALTAVDLSLLGQDQAYFATVGRHGWPAFSAHATDDAHPLWRLLLVPQAWSLSLELAFYLIAPFVNRLRTRSLLVVCAASFALRCYLYVGRGLSDDPWTYRFFPNELLLFVGGMLAYRAFRRATQRGQPPAPPGVLVAVGIAVACGLVGFGAVPATVVLGFELRLWVLVAVSWWAVPYLFALSNPARGRWDRFRRVDRYVGELSYPIYIVHLLILDAIARLSVGRWHAVYEPLAVALTIAAAVGLHHAVMVPVQRVRVRRLRPVPPAVEAAAEVVNP